MQQNKEIRDLAKSLSANAKVLGHNIKLNVAQQIIARMGGYDAWQALIAAKASQIQVKAHDSPVSRGFIRVFVGTASMSEYGDYPLFASFDVMPDFFPSVRRMQQLVQDNNFASIKESWGIDWASNDEFRMQYTELIVFDDSFCFSANPKHADYEVETHLISIDDLEKLVADTVKKGEVCVFCPTGGDNDIVEFIRDHVVCRKVEYDTSFFGGDYSGVGNMVYIPSDDDIDIREMFQRMTGIDPVHIVHIPLDETYTIDGELLELLD